MKLRQILVGLLLALPIFAWMAVAHAQSFQAATNVTVPAGQTVNSTLYAWGSNIDVAGTVNGDVICGGQNVTISGRVNGDVICGGQNVDITGTVQGDVRLAGQDVTISGHVSGNASLAGQSFTLESNGSIGGDTSAAASHAIFNGPIGRDLAAGSDKLTINNRVGRNVRANVEQLMLGNSAEVVGNIAYTSANQLQKSGSAQVGGTVSQTLPAHNGSHVRAGSVIAVAWAFALYLFFAVLLLSMVLVLAMPQTFHRATSYALKHMGKTFLVGFVASLVVPAVLLVLMFTIVGIPLALFAGLVWLVVTLLSGPFAAYLLGRFLLRNSTNALWIMLAGATTLLVVYFVPVLGALVAMAAFWFGLGTILLHLRNTERPRYTVEPEVAAAETPEVPLIRKK